MLNRRTLTIPYLDGWRGIAIITVLIAHFYDRLWWIGNFGVQLFFVLSGYLMGELLFIKEVRLSNFFARRFSRVLPTFLLFVIAMAVYAAIGQSRPYSVPFSELLSTLLFTRTYFPADVSITAGMWPIGHVWSLNVEEHSYIVLAAGALIARAIGRKGAALVFLWLLVIAVVCFNFYYPEHPPGGATEWYRRSEAASYSAFSWLRIKWWPATLLSMSAAVLCFVIDKMHGSTGLPTLKYILTPLFLAFSMNQLMHAPEWLHYLLSLKIVRWFGTCSFSLYLWQQPFNMAFLEHRLPPVTALAAALILGTLSFYCWENPIRLYLNKKWVPHKPKAAIAMPETSVTNM